MTTNRFFFFASAILFALGMTTAAFAQGEIRGCPVTLGALYKNFPNELAKMSVDASAKCVATAETREHAKQVFHDTEQGLKKILENPTASEVQIRQMKLDYLRANKALGVATKQMRDAFDATTDFWYDWQDANSRSGGTVTATALDAFDEWQHQVRLVEMRPYLDDVLLAEVDLRVAELAANTASAKLVCADGSTPRAMTEKK